MMKAAIAAAIFGLSFGGVEAASISGGRTPAVTSGATFVQYGGYCRELWNACRFKEQRGEWGEGNCRRFRAECGEPPRPVYRRPPVHDVYCQGLREACQFKHELGEAGQGNCRRYREECR